MGRPARDGELLRFAADRGATVVPLGVAERLLALVMVEGGDPAREQDVAAIASLAATVLAFVDAGEGRSREQVSDGLRRVVRRSLRKPEAAHVDEATLRFALAGVDDLLDEIRAARLLRAAA